ncbi:hypothetical protein GC194_14290 [bacterium]|nr:hypothetical protein [bacterium]
MARNMKPKFTAESLFVMGIASLLLLPELFTKGMFMDGTIYSTISMNLANGKGTFWSPYYNGLSQGVFYEHPPLFFWLQSIWFRLIGNHFYTERLFDLLVFIISLILLRPVVMTTQRRVTYWLATLYLLLVPKFVWAFNNNMMEVILVPFLLLCFYLLQRQRQKFNLANLLAYSVVSVAFFLVKGPVAFGLIFLPFVFIFNEKWKFILLNTGVILAMTAILGFILMQYEPARNNISTYWNQQIVASITGKRASEHSIHQFVIINGVLEQLVFPLIITFLLLLISKWKFNSIKTSLPYLFTALAFSIPFAAFQKQHIYYLIPSLPFYVMFLASVVDMNALLPKINLISPIIKALGIGAIAASIILSGYNYGEFNRDKELITDLMNIKLQVQNNTVTAATDIRNNWGIFAYSARFDALRFNRSDDNAFLISSSPNAQEGYELVAMETTRLFLFKKLD